VTATFLVAIDIDDPSMVDSLAAEIDDALLEEGFEVISVKPWARPATGGAEAPFLPPPPEQPLF
jgi:hypothetical protein